MGKKIIGIGLLVFFVIGYLFIVFGNELFNQKEQNGQWQTQKSESSVSIDLTPKNFDGKNLVIAINVNTHTVELSQFDLKELTLLETEGKTFSPITAPQLTGHHSSGELTFGLDKKPKEFTVVIKNIPDVPLRIFSW